MTSGIFYTAAIDSITIDERQRKELGDIDDLADSIRRLGLIHPILLTREHALVSGHRRLLACRSLGWTDISFQFYDEIDPLQRELVETEENTRRKDMTWREQHDAYIKYVNLRRVLEPDINMESIGRAIGLNKQAVSNHLTLEKVINNPRVATADGFRTAYNTATRLIERQKQDELQSTLNVLYTSSNLIVVADFNEWAPAYNGPKFNLIHCDFPYGINAHKSEGQSDSSLNVHYDDSPDIYWTLFKTLSVHLDNFCTESAHMIFWFSPTFYCQTWELLKLLDGFQFDEHPLIWLRGSEGIAPDPQRRPRRTYDMAFFGWRNDRKIVRVKNNSFTAPTEREIHPHEKSQAALEYFFEMLVDGQTRLFDPTCGSGSALRAATKLGAETVFGLERDPEFAADANRALEKTRGSLESSSSSEVC